MKKLIAIAVLSMLAFAGIAFAGDMARVPGPYVGAGTVIQFYAPDNTKTLNTTVVHQWVDLSKAVLYSVYSASGTCFERLAPVTGVNGAYIATPIPNTAWHVRAVNSATKFANFSGCVGGFVKIQ